MGKAGEARSAVRYADDGADVIVEPGQTDAYDLAVSKGSNTEYVEVKTRDPDMKFTQEYVDGKLDEMTKKYKNAQSDPDHDIETNVRVLEFRIGSDESKLPSAKTTAENHLDTRKTTPDTRVEVEEIRLVSTDGKTKTVDDI